MAVSDDHIQELKEIMEKESGQTISDEDAAEASHNLAGLAEILFDCWLEDKKREKKLKEFPKGFQLDGVGYTCHICGNGTSEAGNWYDKWGIKCLICQAAVDRGEMPAWVAKHRDGWYSKYDLESRFNLKTVVLKKWMAEGIIKARSVKRESKGLHVSLFLLCDNKGFLPPKKLTESQMVREEKDGQTWHRSEPWYRFVDPFEHLKGYKIMDHMRVIPPEEMKAREEEEMKKQENRYARKQSRKKK